MNRDEFMRELEYLLQDIQEEDKADALSYYRDYLDEAGDDAEQAIREFGSPERIAAIIRSDIAGHLEDGGEFTERGYGDERFRDPNYQVAPRYELPEQSRRTRAEQTSDKQKKNETQSIRNQNMALRVVLGILLVVIGFPIILGVGSGAFGLFTGLLTLLVVLIVLVGVLTLVFFVAGVIAMIAGIMVIVFDPLDGLLAIGIGALVLSLAFLMLVLSVQFYGKFIPWLFNGTINLISGLFRRKERQE